MDPPSGGTLPDFNIDSADPELIPLLVNLLSSEKGAAFRQLILEAVCILEFPILFSAIFSRISFLSVSLFYLFLGKAHDSLKTRGVFPPG